FPFEHNHFELEVHLTGFPGGCYSPEPAFWSATLPGVLPSGDPNLEASESFVDVCAPTETGCTPGNTTVTPVVEGPPGDRTCSDGSDNDGDGFTDRADSDCVLMVRVDVKPGG